MEVVIAILGGLGVILLALLASHFTPKCDLVGPEEPKDDRPMRTYKIISNTGETQTIMTTKTLKELLSEMNELAYKLDDQCTS